MARRHQHHSRIVGRFVKVPEPLADGKVRCPGCSRVLAPTRTGGIGRHVDKYGDPCPVTIRGNQPVELDEVPPVKVPAHPPKRNGWTRRPPAEPSRLDVGSTCRECGKWLPGERSLCGACYVKAGGR
jgi:hypothetical protein